MEPALKPTLQEIAAMPFPASQAAMRKHYNPHWGKPTNEDGTKSVYKVEVTYTVRSEESEIVQVEAFTEEEACDLAEDKVAEGFCGDEEIIDAEVIA